MAKYSKEAARIHRPACRGKICRAWASAREWFLCAPVAWQ